jgi:hypothetical protein
MRRHTHLTVTDPDLQRQIALSVPGMAHFAGSGPNNRCGQCEHWRRPPSVYGTLGAFPCGEYLRLMRVKSGPKVPGLTPACRHFRMRGAST